MSEELEVIIKNQMSMNYCAFGKAKVGFVRINHPAHQPGRWTDCGADCELQENSKSETHTSKNRRRPDQKFN